MASHSVFGLRRSLSILMNANFTTINGLIGPSMPQDFLDLYGIKSASTQMDLLTTADISNTTSLHVVQLHRQLIERRREDSQMSQRDEAKRSHLVPLLQPSHGHPAKATSSYESGCQ